MSLMSMTGRGTGKAANHLARVEVELSSVNRKQLDLNIVLPRFLSSFESPVHECVRKQLARGRVTGEIRVTWSARAQAAALRVDEALVRAQVAALRATAKKMGLADDLSASLLLQLPEAIVVEHGERDLAGLWPVVAQALEAALAKLLTMRRREGAALARDIRARLKQLGAWTKEIRARAPAVAATYRENLLKRIAAALPDNSELAEDERLLKEVALFADRADITEELVRLDSHRQQATHLLRTGGVVGRTLDFLVQEMGREINTIGAKANDGDIIRRVIDCKAELERIREQVQNIE